MKAHIIVWDGKPQFVILSELDKAAVRSFVDDAQDYIEQHIGSDWTFTDVRGKLTQQGVACIPIAQTYEAT